MAPMVGMLPAGVSSMMEVPTFSSNALATAMRQPTPAPAAPAAQNMQPSRPKWAQVVGRIGDVMAMMGGVQPLYQTFTNAERQEQEMEMQRNALAQFIGNNPKLQPFAPYLQAGGKLSDVTELLDAMQGPAERPRPEAVQIARYINDPNIPLEERRLVANIYNQRTASQAVVGSLDRGFNPNPNYEMILTPEDRRGGMGVQVPGNTSQQTAPQMGQPEVPAFTVDQFSANAQAMGPQRAVDLLRRTGMRVQVSSPQEANALPPGTPYITPNGERYTR